MLIGRLRLQMAWNIIIPFRRDGTEWKHYRFYASYCTYYLEKHGLLPGTRDYTLSFRWTGNAVLAKYLQSLLCPEVYPEIPCYTVTMAPYGHILHSLPLYFGSRSLLKTL